MNLPQGPPLNWVGDNLIEANSTLTPALAAQVVCFDPRRTGWPAHVGIDAMSRCQRLRWAQVYVLQIAPYPTSLSPPAVTRLTYLHLVSFRGAGAHHTAFLFTVFASMPALETLIVQHAEDIPLGYQPPAPPFRLRSLRWTFKGSMTFPVPSGQALAVLLPASAHSLEDLLLCDSLAPIAETQIFCASLSHIAHNLRSLRLPDWDVLRYQRALSSILASCTSLRELALQLLFGAPNDDDDDERRTEFSACADVLSFLEAPLRRLEIYMPLHIPRDDTRDWRAPAAAIADILDTVPPLRSLRALSFNTPSSHPEMCAALLRLAVGRRLVVRIRERDEFAWSPA